MAQKKLRPASPCQAATGLGFVKATRPDIPEYSASLSPRQAEIDTVALLAARSRVAPATIRAQLAAWRIGGGL